LVLLASAVVTLSWVHLSSQSTIPRSFRTAVSIVGRLFGIIGLCYIISCAWLGIPVFVFVAGSILALLASPLATHHGVTAGGALEFAVANVLMLPIYVLKQFVLGFPDRDILIPPPPTEHSPPNDLSHLNLSTGTVVATLKPCGTVQIDGSVHSATTANGQYLDSGTSIHVTGVRNTLLVVMAAKTSTMEGA
jgi:membrane-bound ClpP family serine protease